MTVEVHEHGRVSAPEVRASVSGLVSGAMSSLAKRVVGRVPRADLDVRDTDYIRETLPGLWMLASLYFRADVRGLHHIPREGPVLLVGNHSGGMMAPDLFVFVLAFSTYFGVERRFYQLAHNGGACISCGTDRAPYGTVAADPRNAELALSSGAAVLDYPGGDHEVFRPSWESGRSTSGAQGIHPVGVADECAGPADRLDRQQGNRLVPDARRAAREADGAG